MSNNYTGMCFSLIMAKLSEMSNGIYSLWFLWIWITFAIIFLYCTTKKTMLPIKKSKLNNVRITIDGINFQSKKEATRYENLKLMERQGLIENLRLQVPFVIADECIIEGRKRSARKYIADFVYTQDGKEIIEDVKGAKTGQAWNMFSLKRHLMKSKLGLDIVIY